MSTDFTTPNEATLAGVRPAALPVPLARGRRGVRRRLRRTGIGSRFRAKAHPHTVGGHAGWICVLSHRRLFAAACNGDGTWVTSVGVST